ncbi:MAG: DUF6434 domain-containing protein [Chloroflexota bacterium]
MPRPSLTNQLDPAEFARCYWLKAELIAFCRQNHLPSGGAKQALAERIAGFLAGEKPSAEVSPRAQAGAMPTHFTRSMQVGAGWRCSQALRAFFEQEIGPRFHFDATMRDLIHHGCGKTLEEVILCWQSAQEQPPVEREIAPQFEYNRHIRDYFKTHPGASLQEAIRAWKLKTQ